MPIKASKHTFLPLSKSTNHSREGGESEREEGGGGIILQRGVIGMESMIEVMMRSG